MVRELLGGPRAHTDHHRPQTPREAHSSDLALVAGVVLGCAIACRLPAGKSWESGGGEGGESRRSVKGSHWTCFDPLRTERVVN